MFWRQWNCELIKRYRLNREGIKLVVELLRDAITSPTNRNNSISPVWQHYVIWQQGKCNFAMQTI